MTKKILFISAFIPSNKTAGQNYTSQLISDISRKVKVDLVTFKSKNDDIGKKFSKNVFPLKVIETTKFKKLINSLKIPFLHPFFSCRFNFKLAFYLRKISKNYDYVYFYFSQINIY
jgi:hypothetical protein